MSDQKRPRAWFEDERPFLPSLTVFQDDDKAVDTGLLDATGTKVFRRPKVEVIGFDLSGRRK